MISAAILGATGYTGQELVRLLAQHPDVQLKGVTTQSYGGSNITDVFPHLKGSVSIACSETDIESMSNYDVVFIALPHGVASNIVTKDILKKTRVIDLGADFRLKDVGAYEQWYNTAHGNKALVENAAYGLTEWNEAEIANANLVANPGCYATAAALAMLPLVSEGLVEPSSILIDAKSGVSGAGRATNQAVHFNECNETIKAYGLATHRHTPEIEEQLDKFAPGIKITFTPHLVPMNRGILVTAYGSLKKNVTSEQVLDLFSLYYADKPFVRLCKSKSAPAALPETRWVKGSNFCDIGCVVDERTNRVIVVAALDNLMKGAAGQAVQNMNVMFGLNQNRGLNHVPIFPA
jgi:N-acetyl-gamma-glutamyl-phosphate reductase